MSSLNETSEESDLRRASNWKLMRGFYKNVVLSTV